VDLIRDIWETFADKAVTMLMVFGVLLLFWSIICLAGIVALWDFVVWFPFGALRIWAAGMLICLLLALIGAFLE